MKAAKHAKTKLSSRQASKQSAPAVHFELTFPSAGKVCVAGTFNDWKPEAGEMTRLEDGTWVKDLHIERGTYEYRLVVDGQWMPDPQAEHGVVNSFGEKNSLLTVP